MRLILREDELFTFRIVETSVIVLEHCETTAEETRMVGFPLLVDREMNLFFSLIL